MASLITKYSPNTQKELFHKDICAHIRKWIVNLNNDDILDKKKILFIYGPIGCGKSATIDILFKGFSLILIDSNELRLEKSSGIINSIVGFNDITLSNIEKWNHSNKKQKQNIVLIDNIELCEKNIVSFIDNIHNKYKINVPIVLICNNQKYKDLFLMNKNQTFIEFSKPSLLELTKLIININEIEKLKLTKSQIIKLIEISLYDIRQIFYLLEQWKINPHNFDTFLEIAGTKHTDIDLSDKLIYLTDNYKTFDLNYSFLLSASEPSVISNGIFQNYIDIIQFYKEKESENEQEIKEKPIEHDSGLETSLNILDNISNSNIFYSKIMEEQYWELYEDYTMYSCVIPSYYIKNISNYTNSLNEKELYYKMNSFKDVSYNYMNSFEEVKKISFENFISNKINYSNIKHTDFFTGSFEFFYYFINMCITNIKIINNYFESNKKGKNTSKNEKIDLCKNITGKEKETLDSLVQNIYDYKIFEVSIDDILLNKKKYLQKTSKKEKDNNEKDNTEKNKKENKNEKDNNEKDKNTIKKSKKEKYEKFGEELIIEDVDKIDLRVFKRLLNIFTFFESSKVLKSHVEMAIKYKLFHLLLNEIDEKNTIYKQNDIDSLIVELSDILNF
jgi:hypothetical protein